MDMLNMGVMFLSATSPASTFLSEVTNVLTTIVSWFGTIITALVTSDGALNPLFPFVAISFGIGIVWMVIKMVKKFVPGF